MGNRELGRNRNVGSETLACGRIGVHENLQRPRTGVEDRQRSHVMIRPELFDRHGNGGDLGIGQRHAHFNGVDGLQRAARRGEREVDLVVPNATRSHGHVGDHVAFDQ